MASFERPCSGFTATDLISLQAIWPDGTHVSDGEGDRFVVRRRGEGVPWLAIQRRRDGRYVSLDLSGRIFAEGRSLADLALDGTAGGERPPALPMMADAAEWQGRRWGAVAAGGFRSGAGEQPRSADDLAGDVDHGQRAATQLVDLIGSKQL